MAEGLNEMSGVNNEPSLSNKVIFISYSHDSGAHREQVLKLSERLRQDGLYTELDQYINGSPEMGWPRWMLDKLDEATYVLVICTKTYYRRFRGHDETGKGKGVDWEGALITQEIYNSRHKTCKFVPVLFNETDQSYIPEPLRVRTHYVLNNQKNYDAFYDFLLGQAGVEARKLGKLITKPKKAVEPLTFFDENNFKKQR